MSPTCQRQRGTPSVELERDEQLVAARVDDAAGPLVGREPEARVADDEHRVERGEAEHPAPPARRPPTTSSPW